jgi:hypothetical protein
MMRAPPPSLASYMEAIAKKPEQGPLDKAPLALKEMIQNEMQKYKMLQEKKASLHHELTMIDQNLLKVQGSLEVFQAMGYIKLNA